jgi:Rrf2 family protein
MSHANVQFSVASHVMAVLGTAEGHELRSAELASSVNADPSFVRRVVSKLVKAGLVSTTRGKNGACALARPASKITLLDIYQASQATASIAVHSYPVDKTCCVSRNIKDCMVDVLQQAQHGFEQSLAQQTLADVVKSVRKDR